MREKYSRYDDSGLTLPLPAVLAYFRAIRSCRV